MGRPKKQSTPTNIQTLAKEAIAQREQRLGKSKIKFRPVQLYEVLITHPDYTFESHLFDEKGLEYIVKMPMRGGEK